MSSRDEFVTVQAALVALREEDQALRARLQAEVTAAVHEAAVAAAPKKKTKAATEAFRRKLAGDYVTAADHVPDVHNAESQRATAVYEAAYDSFKERREALKAQLRAAAETAPVELGEAWLPYDSVYTVSYNSQGFGASAYAQRAAEMEADHARHHGVEAVVVRYADDHACRDGGLFERTFAPGERWIVAVRVASELDVAILKAKPPPSLKETLRAIMKRGGNVRVFYPTLPWGIEAKLGLDAFGNDLKEERNG